MLRFDPFSDLDSIARGVLMAHESGTPRTPRFMPMDLQKVDENYLLTADLPGVDPDSIDVSIDNGVLTLSAHRSPPSDDGAKWLAAERFVGTYRRQITLGDGVDPDGISAQYDNGVLTVVIPVAERAKPRRIAISTAGEPRAISANSA
ncbi:Hsp20/alpha crystallin family protein [Gordonia neofelifaecis]|uniref:Heat shock protein Hsp20 n=1 Tax=Gordonia neofelifaecis NRRL B-59395 TaxID=644548 RepID=F1YPR1_9ACTN|nr:Hsp20/alpha crystallin family protein [Gordonia neofelifaecis]EGD53340.1 heat shock protein Hsp20 [Gordonia neofelifaecis NRRL B-59395]